MEYKRNYLTHITHAICCSYLSNILLLENIQHCRAVTNEKRPTYVYYAPSPARVFFLFDSGARMKRSDFKTGQSNKSMICSRRNTIMGF